MKKIFINKTINVLTLMIFTFTPLTGFAGDMWAETPDLDNDSEVASIVSGPTKLTKKRPTVDLWTETPSLNADTKDHGFFIEGNVWSVYNFTPEMYAETPDPFVVEAQRKDKVRKDLLFAEDK